MILSSIATLKLFDTQERWVTTTLAIIEDSDQFIATRLRGYPPHLHLVIPIDAPVAIHIQPHWTHELSTTALPGFLLGEFFTFIKTVDGVVAITQINATMDILPKAIPNLKSLSALGFEHFCQCCGIRTHISMAELAPVARNALKNTLARRVVCTEFVGLLQFWLVVSGDASID